MFEKEIELMLPHAPTCCFGLQFINIFLSGKLLIACVNLRYTENKQMYSNSIQTTFD